MQETSRTCIWTTAQSLSTKPPSRSTFSLQGRRFDRRSKMSTQKRLVRFTPLYPLETDVDEIGNNAIADTRLVLSYSITCPLYFPLLGSVTIDCTVTTAHCFLLLTLTLTLPLTLPFSLSCLLCLVPFLLICFTVIRLIYSVQFNSIQFHSIQVTVCIFYSILFYSILFQVAHLYADLFYSILIYFNLFYSNLFYSILFYSILFQVAHLYPDLFYSNLF